MSKKTFAAAPTPAKQPTPEAIDAFVSGGHGKDNGQKTPAAKGARLTIDLTPDQHTRFKAACTLTRRKMVDEVRQFIERRTAELEEEARIRR